MYDICTSQVDTTLARHVAHVCVYIHMYTHVHSYRCVCISTHIHMFDILMSGVDTRLGPTNRSQPIDAYAHIKPLISYGCVCIYLHIHISLIFVCQGSIKRWHDT